MARIRVLHFGLGPIGAAIAKQIAERPGFTIVGAVDVDLAKAGRDLGDIIGLSRRLRVPIHDAAYSLLKSTRPDIVIHCTSSSLKAVMPQLTMILGTKTPVISTTEELAYPWRTSAPLARTLDALAKRSKVAVLATGVNPGFAMDALPLAITAACERVDRIRVRRVQDARIRRLPFQQKIGAGLSLEEFRARVAQGTVRHVGFTQSIAMIADALGWRLDRITDQVAPKLARTAVASTRVKVKAGQVAGIIQDGVGYRKGEALISLHLEAYLGAPESYDSVDVDGSPKLSMKFSGGIHGDIATASMVVNAIPNVLAAAPGLRTMRDLQRLHYFSGHREIG